MKFSDTLVNNGNGNGNSAINSEKIEEGVYLQKVPIAKVHDLTDSKGPKCAVTIVNPWGKEREIHLLAFIKDGKHAYSDYVQFAQHFLSDPEVESDLSIPNRELVKAVGKEAWIISYAAGEYNGKQSYNYWRKLFPVNDGNAKEAIIKAWGKSKQYQKDFLIINGNHTPAMPAVYGVDDVPLPSTDENNIPF